MHKRLGIFKFVEITQFCFIADPPTGPIYIFCVNLRLTELFNTIRELFNISFNGIKPSSIGDIIRVSLTAISCPNFRRIKPMLGVAIEVRSLSIQFVDLHNNEAGTREALYRKPRH